MDPVPAAVSGALGILSRLLGPDTLPKTYYQCK